MSRITDIDMRTLKPFLKALYREINDDDVLSYAGALAYHTLLALFPFLLFLLALVTFLHIPAAFDELIAWSNRVLPAQGAEQINNVLGELEQSRNGSILSLAVIGALWAASGGVRSAMSALNRAFDVEESRPFLKRYYMSLLFTIAAALIIILANGLLIIGPSALTWLAVQLGIRGVFVTIWTWSRYPVAALLLMIFSALAYSTLPNVAGVRWFTAGAVFNVIGWIILSYAFQLYLTNFGHYEAVYGSIGAVIVLLLYFYMCSVVLLIGGEINALIRAGSVDPEQI